MIRPLMPMVRTDLGLNYTQVGIALSAFSISSGFSQLLGGWLCSRFGPRVSVALGVSGVATAALLIGFSQSYSSLIVFFVIAAMLGGSYHPASVTAISSLVPPQQQGRALGIHTIGGTSTFWVAPLLAAPIALVWGWRGSYITLAIPTILLGIMLYILIGRRTQVLAREPQTTKTDVPTALARTRWRQLIPFLVMSVATGTIIRSVVAYFSLYFVDHFGVAEASAIMLIAITPAVSLFAAPLGGYLFDRMGGVLVLITISILGIPLIYLLGVMPSIPSFIVVMAALGIVTYTRMPASEAFIIGNTSKTHRPKILGFYFFAGMETGGLLTPLVGNLIDRFGFSQSFTIASITLAAATVVCSFFLLKSRG